jgi:3-oxoacyl-[acyl-carrier-protein] synthase II
MSPRWRRTSTAAVRRRTRCRAGKLTGLIVEAGLEHRVLLETAWGALEHAGLDPLGAPARTGVYVDCSASEHALAAQTDHALADQLGSMQLQILTGQHFLAPWLSYRLNLQGPSLTVQAACATSLAAIHLAVQALLLNECDLALAGGVSIDCVRKRGYRFLPGGILAPDGRCRPFDERAGGTVPGSGAGLLVMRRLEDAQAEHDPVLAVIRGTAVTNDGSAKLGFTAPSIDRQSAALAEAWAVAGLNSSDAQYIEMHGTATRLGDRVEVSAAAMALESSGQGSCAIGSVKANIGHLDAAAGVAGVIKTVLMLQHGLLVPSANVTRPHPDLALDSTPFRLRREYRLEPGDKVLHAEPFSFAGAVLEILWPLLSGALCSLDPVGRRMSAICAT